MVKLRLRRSRQKRGWKRARCYGACNEAKISGRRNQGRCPASAHCHELRVRDRNKNWRIIYRIDEDAIVIVEVFNKTTRTTPQEVIANCQRRLRMYDES
jgi:phage-related protein